MIRVGVDTEGRGQDPKLWPKGWGLRGPVAVIGLESAHGNKMLSRDWG